MTPVDHRGGDALGAVLRAGCPVGLDETDGEGEEPGQNRVEVEAVFRPDRGLGDTDIEVLDSGERRGAGEMSSNAAAPDRSTYRRCSNALMAFSPLSCPPAGIEQSPCADSAGAGDGELSEGGGVSVDVAGAVVVSASAGSGPFAGAESSPVATMTPVTTAATVTAAPPNSRAARRRLRSRDPDAALAGCGRLGDRLGPVALTIDEPCWLRTMIDESFLAQMNPGEVRIKRGRVPPAGLPGLRWPGRRSEQRRC